MATTSIAALASPRPLPRIHSSGAPQDLPRRVPRPARVLVHLAGLALVEASAALTIARRTSWPVVVGYACARFVTIMSSSCGNAPCAHGSHGVAAVVTRLAAWRRLVVALVA